MGVFWGKYQVGELDFESNIGKRWGVAWDFVAFGWLHLRLN